MVKRPAEDVEEVVWLEDPRNYEYLREGVYGTTQRSGKLSVNGKLIGYENVRKKGKGTQTYRRRFWYLKEYDRGMPKESEGYGKHEKGGTTPAEAVSSEDIYMPPDANVIKEFEVEGAVPEVSTTKEKNELWRKSEKREVIFFVIEKKRKYARINYDMYNTPYDLTKECVDKLKECFKGYIYEELSKDERKRTFKGRSIRYSFGETSGFVDSIKLHEARILAKKIKNILLDEDNWISLEKKQKKEMFP